MIVNQARSMAGSTLGWPGTFEVWGFGRGSDFIPGAMEAIGGCELGSDLFALCKIALAVVRRVDLREQEGKRGNTVRQDLGWKMWAWRL